MSCEMIQDDATYKCNWYQYPLFVAGRSTPTGRFYQTHLALSSHEDTAAWIRIHAWVRSVLPRMPRYLVFSIIGRKKLNSKLVWFGKKTLLII